ncbi:MAG: hypothetical protein KDD73_06005 [Anaerolineales bacterium]|nr:hypothetical protein [Anaerolineales bacterium]MCB9128643.1 hypothetical protein [Ardenticatenales bacterium]MCB9172875.1 hypothetical protein [Ardenticatenales bacterium]
MDILLEAHSGLRWIVVLAGLLLLVWTAIVWLTKREDDALTSRLFAAYNAALGIQFVLGLLYFILDGAQGAGYPLYRIEHFITLLIAIAVAGIGGRWRGAVLNVRARNIFLTTLVSLILIYVGVARVPAGWSM